jgi:hypothetical protein
MCTDPDPQHAVLNLYRQRPMVQADTGRPKLPEFLEM